MNKQLMDVSEPPQQRLSSGKWRLALCYPGDDRATFATTNLAIRGNVPRIGTWIGILEVRSDAAFFPVPKSDRVGSKLASNFGGLSAGWFNRCLTACFSLYQGPSSGG